MKKHPHHSTSETHRIFTNIFGRATQRKYTMQITESRISANLKQAILSRRKAQNLFIIIHANDFNNITK